MALEKINVALLHLLYIRNRHVSVGGGGHSGELSEIIQNNWSKPTRNNCILVLASQA